MANFLSEIKALAGLDLNKTELKKATVENQPDDTGAGTGVEGQIYFNTTADVLKVWAGGSWTEVGGGVISLSSGNANTITIGGTAANPTISANTSAVTNGSLNLVTAGSVYSYINSGTSLVNSLTAGANITLSGSTGNITISSTDTNTTYTAGTGLTLSGTTFNHTNAITAGNTGDSGVTRTLAYGGTFVVPYVTYDAQGHITSTSNKTLTLPTSVFPNAFAWSNGTTAGPTGSLTGPGVSVSYAAIPTASGSISGIVTTAAQTFAGTKTFSNDVVISGNLTISGTTTTVNSETVLIADNIITLNSNFTTGTPTENAGIEVLRGTSATTSLLWNESTDRWTFTNNGSTFYDIPITGDVVVNNGTLTVNGTGALSGSGTFTANQAGNTTISITHADTSAQASVDNSGLNVIQDITLDTYGHITGIGSVDVTAQVNALITARTFTNTGPSTVSTSYAISAATHGLGTDSTIIMVQLVLVATGETVYADVTRGASGLITISFAQAQPINSIRALLHKIV